MELSKRQAFAVIAGIVVLAGLAVPYFAGVWSGDRGTPAANPTDPSAPNAGETLKIDIRPGVSTPSVGGAPGGGAVTAPAPGGAAASGPQTKKSVAPAGLSLKVAILDPHAHEGEPVRARVTIENSGKLPITLCDPLLDVPRRIEMLYRYRNVNYCALCPPGPMERLDSTKLVEMTPGRALEVVVDLRPLFDAALGFGEGPFQFRLAYRGATEAVPTAVRAWNGDPGRVATSDNLVFHAPVATWFEEMGGDGELLNSLASRIAIWAPGSPEDDQVVAHVKSLGQPAIAALSIVASRMGSLEPNAGMRARKSLLMLRQLGAEAVPVLKRVPQSVAVSMVIGVIEEDLRERTGGGPSEASRPFRSVGGGDQGTSFVVSVMRPEMAGSVSYTYDASGTVLVTRWETRDRKTTHQPRLSTDQVADIKRSILRSRPWIWKPVRGAAHEGEGEAGFALASKDGATLWLHSFRGDEAREGNPFTADVLRAFQMAVGEDPSLAPAPGSGSVPTSAPPPTPAPPGPRK